MILLYLAIQKQSFVLYIAGCISPTEMIALWLPTQSDGHICINLLRILDCCQYILLKTVLYNFFLKNSILFTVPMQFLMGVIEQ